MNDQERHDFYADPANLRVIGPGRKRKAPMLSSMVPVRFTPEFIERVKSVAFDEGVTVSTWIRRAASRELEREAPVAGSRTFRCEHLSVSGQGVTSASCQQCGPITAVA